MKLSVCLILKNESSTIRKCLDSVKGFVNDYVIGIDDATKDNTKEEVLKFIEDNKDIDVNLYDYKWDDSFADARNAGMDKAKGDFILIMDGHEYFPTTWFNITENREMPVQSLIPKILEKIDEEQTDEAFVMLYQQPFVGAMPNNYFLQPRIYRNGIGKDGKNLLRFGRAAHNVIRNSDPEKSIHFPEIILIHDAPEDNRAERATQRAGMNVKQLKADLKINEKDTRALFYLGNTYMETKEYELAAESFEKYLACKTVATEEKYQVNFHLGICYKDLKKNKEAFDSFYRAIRISPMRRDAYLLVGDMFMDADKPQEALHNYNSALLIKPECSRMFSNGAAHTWMPYQRCALAYKALGDNVKAVSHMRRAQRFVQTPEWEKFIEECSGKKKNILIIDAFGSFTFEIAKSLSEKYNVLTTKRFDRYLAEWADVIWQEWGDQNLLENTVPHKTMVRIHGYEAYLNVNILQSIKWETFKNVVFVADHIKDMLPFITSKVRSRVIQNGVDTDKFYIKEMNRNKKSIGYAGFLNVKKNPMRLAKYIVDNPDYIFNLRVDWQDAFLKSSFEYETRDCKNIVYHARYGDLNDFWNQMEFVISTSDIESFSYNVAEAMSCGCHPLVYPWKGANTIWPSSSLISKDKLYFNVVNSRQDEREYIKENYPLNKQIVDMTKELMYVK